MAFCVLRFVIQERFLAVLLVGIFASPSAVAENGPPKKLAIPDDKRIILASEGSPLLLRCPVETSSFILTDWYKGNSSLYNEDGYKITDRGALKVINVSKQHEGSYTCHATNGFGTVIVNLTLIVDDSEVNRSSTRQIQNTTGRQLGIAPSFKKKQLVTVSEEVGRSVTLHCSATGHPTPFTIWLKEGVLRNEAGKGKIHSTLKIEELKKSDAGIYRCIAKNKVGEAHLDFRLEVTDPIGPPKIVSLTPLTVVIKSSLTAVFSCEVNSKPGLNLHIKWFKGLTDEEIRDSQALDDITLFRSNSLFYRPLNISQSFVTQDGIYKSKLMIENTVKEDSGTYVCFALNDRGFVFKNATLNVVTTAIHLSGTTYESAVLSGLSFAVPVIILLVLLGALAVVVLLLKYKMKASSKKLTSKVPATCDERASLKHEVLVPCMKYEDSLFATTNSNSNPFYAYEHSESTLPKMSNVL